MKNLILFAIITIGITSTIACNNSPEATDDANATAMPSTPQMMVLAGEKTFKQNCKMCHGINASESSGMAPILDSVKTHWPEKTALAKYIKNAKENLDINAHTKALYQQWKDKPQMPPYLGLSDGEVDELVEYLHAVSN